MATAVMSPQPLPTSAPPAPAPPASDPFNFSAFTSAFSSALSSAGLAPAEASKPAGAPGKPVEPDEPPPPDFPKPNSNLSSPRPMPAAAPSPGPDASPSGSEPKRPRSPRLANPQEIFGLPSTTVLLDQFYCSKQGTFGKMFAFRTHVCFTDVFNGETKDIISLEEMTAVVIPEDYLAFSSLEIHAGDKVHRYGTFISRDAAHGCLEYMLQAKAGLLPFSDYVPFTPESMKKKEPAPVPVEESPLTPRNLAREMDNGFPWVKVLACLAVVAGAAYGVKQSTELQAALEAHMQYVLTKAGELTDAAGERLVGLKDAAGTRLSSLQVGERLGNLKSATSAKLASLELGQRLGGLRDATGARFSNMRVRERLGNLKDTAGANLASLKVGQRLGGVRDATGARLRKLRVRQRLGNLKQRAGKGVSSLKRRFRRAPEPEPPKRGLLSLEVKSGLFKNKKVQV